MAITKPNAVRENNFLFIREICAVKSATFAASIMLFKL